LAGVRRRLRHPGAPVWPRVDVVRGLARDVAVELRAGESLQAGLARAMGPAGALVVDLAGLLLGRAVFVQPAESADAGHAAWYSAERVADTIDVAAGVAMVGWRGGEVFVHAHALWQGGAARVLGHLLNDRAMVARDQRLPGIAFEGGRFVQHPDPETNFPLFRAEGAGVPEGDAAILTVRPHEEIGAVVAGLVAEFGWEGASVAGLGSLIGARFRTGRDMTSPISEMLVMPGASDLALEVVTVDLAAEVFGGVLLPGGGEVCVTAELILRRIGG
jgi:hypothetical protein